MESPIETPSLASTEDMAGIVAISLVKVAMESSPGPAYTPVACEVVEKPAKIAGSPSPLEGGSNSSGQGADRLFELIDAAIAEARRLDLIQVEVRLCNARSAARLRRVK